MNKKIGTIAALANVLSVSIFALATIFVWPFVAYFSSMFIAFSFVPMVCAFSAQATPDARTAGNTAVIFAGMYAVFIVIIYFTQLTTLRNETLSPEMTTLLDYSAFSWFFNLNLMGYGLMSLSTFFAGLTLRVRKKSHGVLKFMLLGHGIFFISGIIMPMLGVFSAMDDAHFIGSLILLIWCAIFIPIGMLSYFYLQEEKT